MLQHTSSAIHLFLLFLAILLITGSLGWLSEGIQLKKLNTHRIKEKGWTGACAGTLQSPEGADETCRPEHQPGQASGRRQ